MNPSFIFKRAALGSFGFTYHIWNMPGSSEASVHHCLPQVIQWVKTSLGSKEAPWPQNYPWDD